MMQTDRSGLVIDMRRTRLNTAVLSRTDYDPRDHRAPKDPMKVWMAYFALLRLMCGSGMLAMPLATSQMGIVLGPVLTLLTGFLIIFTHRLMLGSIYEVARQLRIPYISYRYGFRLALLHGPPALHWIGDRGPTIIAMFMVLTQLALCSVMVIFTSECLKALMDWESNVPALACLYVPFILIEVFMEDISKISYLVMSGNFLNVIGLGIVFGHIAVDYNGEEVSAKTSVGAVLFGFGTLLFNLSSVGVILSLDKCLKDARKLTSAFGVLNVGIMLPTILAMVFGALGYYSFGTMEENILRSLPYDQVTSMLAVSLYLVSVGSAYPLQAYPAIMTIIEVIKYHDVWATPTDQSLECIANVGRPLFVTLSFAICYVIPFQGPLVAFVGNLCTTMLQLVFPALMDLSLRYPNRYGRNQIHLYIDLSIVFLGLICFTVGVYNCGYLIHVRMMSQYSPNSGFA
ncbi:hypothetical protein PYW07_005961 [Mythimna separata]|uniref:Amino acid transporter transmembrane domain-containing protein n=1 Tax=Mythimna separata TaxID=271217 RepID=A0AAD7YKY3_MYTSE|nr:hypothetical protein PYW07_005961 [Mythimna separata]